MFSFFTYWGAPDEQQFCLFLTKRLRICLGKQKNCSSWVEIFGTPVFSFLRYWKEGISVLLVKKLLKHNVTSSLLLFCGVYTRSVNPPENLSKKLQNHLYLVGRAKLLIARKTMYNMPLPRHRNRLIQLSRQAKWWRPSFHAHDGFEGPSPLESGLAFLPQARMCEKKKTMRLNKTSEGRRFPRCGGFAISHCRLAQLFFFLCIPATVWYQPPLQDHIFHSPGHIFVCNTGCSTVLYCLEAYKGWDKIPVMCLCLKVLQEMLDSPNKNPFSPIFLSFWLVASFLHRRKD